MSQIVVRRNHALPVTELKRRVESIARRLKDDWGGSYEWVGDVLRFRGTGASGQLAVEADSLEVRVDIGLLLTPLGPSIERQIAAVCDEHLAGTARPAKVSGDASGSRPARVNADRSGARPARVNAEPSARRTPRPRRRSP